MKQDYICAGALTEESLTGAVSDFLYRVRPHRERLWDYYEGQQPVPKGEAVRGRPNNLLRVPFPRYITEVPGISSACPLPFPMSARRRGGSMPVCLWIICSLTSAGT